MRRPPASFGLLHGFGFASVLSDLTSGQSELASALAGFNKGVGGGGYGPTGPRGLGKPAYKTDGTLNEVTLIDLLFDVEQLADLLGVDLDEQGFYRRRDPENAPAELSRPGIYVAGSAGAPAIIPECVAQGGAAAMEPSSTAFRAMSISSFTSTLVFGWRQLSHILSQFSSSNCSPK